MTGAVGQGESGVTAIIARMPDKEDRILRRRLAEYQAQHGEEHANLGRAGAEPAEAPGGDERSEHSDGDAVQAAAR